MRRVPDIEYSVLQMPLERESRLTEGGTSLWLAGLNPNFLEVVRHTSLPERPGREQMFFNARAAIKRYQALNTKPAPRSLTSAWVAVFQTDSGQNKIDGSPTK